MARETTFAADTGEVDSMAHESYDRSDFRNAQQPVPSFRVPSMKLPDRPDPQKRGKAEGQSNEQR